MMDYNMQTLIPYISPAEYDNVAKEDDNLIRFKTVLNF